METSTAIQEITQRIERIEEAYEFMLAYAAQGREDEAEDMAPGIRDFLRRIDSALDCLPDIAATAIFMSRGETHVDFIDVLAADVRHARAIVRYVLACSSIDSQVVDNLNASIHVRSLLTDLFLIAESLG